MYRCEYCNLRMSQKAPDHPGLQIHSSAVVLQDPYLHPGKGIHTSQWNPSQPTSQAHVFGAMHSPFKQPKITLFTMNNNY